MKKSKVLFKPVVTKKLTDKKNQWKIKHHQAIKQANMEEKENQEETSIQNNQNDQEIEKHVEKFNQIEEANQNEARTNGLDSYTNEQGWDQVNNMKMVQESSNMQENVKHHEEYKSTSVIVDQKVNEEKEEDSYSIPFKIKALPGLNLVVHLEGGTPQDQNKKEKNRNILEQKIEMTSPDRKVVTAWVPDNPPHNGLEET